MLRSLLKRRSIFRISLIAFAEGGPQVTGVIVAFLWKVVCQGLFGTPTKQKGLEFHLFRRVSQDVYGFYESYSVW